MKTGGSTAVGVHVRIARNIARRQIVLNGTTTIATAATAATSAAAAAAAKTTTTTGKTTTVLASLSSSLLSSSSSTLPMCRTRHDHTAAHVLGYGSRDRRQSFLWTTIRDPTKRAISQFFHFEVSRKKVEPTDMNFRQWIRDARASNIDQYYLRALATTPYSIRNSSSSSSSSTITTITDGTAVRTANQILQDYDFIAITERMDESIVALQLILNLTIADVLYLNAKRQGEFDDGGYRQECVRVQASFVSPGMREYFTTSDEWKIMTHVDTLLHQAANRSLDLTIEQSIGRERFDTALRKFRHAQQVIQKHCFHKARFPCSSRGIYQPAVAYHDCLWHDSGCGKSCIDDLASQQEEWNQHL